MTFDRLEFFDKFVVLRSFLLQLLLKLGRLQGEKEDGKVADRFLKKPLHSQIMKGRHLKIEACLTRVKKDSYIWNAYRITTANRHKKRKMYNYRCVYKLYNFGWSNLVYRK